MEAIITCVSISELNEVSGLLCELKDYSQKRKLFC